MKLECKLENMNYAFTQKCTKFEFSAFGDITSNLEEYLGKKVNLELKKEKRSLNANRVFVAAFRGTPEQATNPQRGFIQKIHLRLWCIRCVLHER